MMTSKLVA